MEKSLRPYTVNLINSVIGVSILAMPFCFYKCGYILGVLVLGFVAYITYLSSCQLLHLAHFHKKRTYEFLALHVFGSLGKLVVELCMIGMIMGTFVAFFVIIGDLGPEIAKDVFRIETSPRMRAVFLICLAVFVVLPLSMQKNIESLSNVSAVSLIFYSVFLLHIICMALQRIFSGEASPPMIQWNMGGIFKCMPIMSMAFGLQPQLFIVYEALSEPNMAVMQTVVKTTLYFVSSVYVGVGISGYFAFSSHEVLPGDILTLYPNTLSINILKIGFALTVAISFPLLIFPLRASLYSLIFLQKGTGSDLTEEATTYMPDHQFKAITIFVIFFTLICGIIVPNVEFVLALTGSVTGSVMFFILPALMYLKTFGTRTSLLPPKSAIPFSSSTSTSSHRRLRIHPLIVLVTGVCVLIVGSMIAVEDQQVQSKPGGMHHKSGSGPKATVTFGDNMKKKIEELRYRQQLLRKMKIKGSDRTQSEKSKVQETRPKAPLNLSLNASMQKLTSRNSSKKAVYFSINATTAAQNGSTNISSSALGSSSVSGRGLSKNASKGVASTAHNLKPLSLSVNASVPKTSKRDTGQQKSPEDVPRQKSSPSLPPRRSTTTKPPRHLTTARPEQMRAPT